METFKFEAVVAPHPKGSSLKIEGQELDYVRGFRIHSHLDDESASKVEITMLALKPFKITGEGEIVVETKVVNKEIARQVYESLKAIFEGKENSQ